MDNNNTDINEILKQMNEVSLSDEDKEKMREILKKYSTNNQANINQDISYVEPEFTLEPEFELPDNEWEALIELDESNFNTEIVT